MPFPMLCLLAALAMTTPTAPTTADATLVAGAAAQGAATYAGADVLTSQDLKNALDLEAQKQLVSCGEAASCLAEIASALDARIVVSGTLALVGDELVLQLSVFDVRAARSVGRRMLRAATLATLLTATEDATRALLAPTLASPAPPDPSGAPASKVRVLVLDLAIPAASSAPPPPPAPAPSVLDRFGWWSVGGLGGVVVGGGALALGVGGVDLAQRRATAALDVALRPAASRKFSDEAQLYGGLAVTALALGGTLVLGGVGAVVADGVIE